MKVFGKNVFNELKNDISSIKKVYLSKSFNDKEIIDFIKNNKISYTTTDNKTMDKMVEGKHQGIIVITNDYEYKDYKSMYTEKLVVMLDHLEDPHNFGAIIRTCEAAGVYSVIIPKDRGVSVSPTVMKTSAGALERVNIAMVNNLNKTILDFKKNGFFVYGADMDGSNYKDIDFADKVLLIIGNEGKGMSRLVRESCDEIVSIPQYGKINSLNASVAAGIIIYGIINR